MESKTRWRSLDGNAQCTRTRWYTCGEELLAVSMDKLSVKGGDIALEEEEAKYRVSLLAAAITIWPAGWIECLVMPNYLSGGHWLRPARTRSGCRRISRCPDDNLAKDHSDS